MNEESLINDEIVIDFELPDIIKNLIKDLEEANENKNYGKYCNYSDGIEDLTKDFVICGILSSKQRNLLIKKYCERWWNLWN